MRLLLAEDDPLLGEGLKTALGREGYTVDWLKDGQQALQALTTEEYVAVILDLGLPNLDGHQILKKARAREVATPVLVLTARDGLCDKVTSLDMGADDYLSKPFEIEELFARIRALIRRSSGRSQPSLRYDDLLIDPATHQVSKKGKPVPLSNKEFSLLLYMLEHQGRPLSRSQLESQLYGWDQEVASNALQVHIHNLRKKLGKKLIKTVRGFGYMVP